MERVRGGAVRPGTSGRQWKPSWDRLEARAMLDAGAGYVLSGFRWANPSRITYSIVPDGVSWDHGTSNLVSVMDAKFGAGNWERALARALQTWAVSANIDIVPVSDSGQPFNTLGQTQGDPRFGDIRVGGYGFTDPSIAAQTYNPPASSGNQTYGGDSEINTSVGWSLGSGVDLYSVMLHEFGLALGLGETTDPSAVMNQNYGGVRAGLTPQDIAGIRAIYGPRQFDAYQSQGQATSFPTAVDLTPRLDGSGQALVPGVSLATIGDTEFFSVVAPAVSGASLRATAIAAGVSQLSPQVTLYDPSWSPIDVEGQPSAYGDNVQATAGGVVPGRRYFIAVTGATHDVFSVGSYQLQVAFVGGTPLSPPTPTPPPAPVPVVTPPAPPAPAPVVVPTPAPSTTTVAAPAPIAPAPAWQSPVAPTSPLPIAPSLAAFRFHAPASPRFGWGFAASSFGFGTAIRNPFFRPISSAFPARVMPATARFGTAFRPTMFAAVARFGFLR